MLLFFLSSLVMALCWIFRRYIFYAGYTIGVLVSRVKSFVRRTRDRILAAIDPTFPVQRKGPEVEDYESFWKD
jgi:hypothetical protein